MITYGRVHLLEEALHSFLIQDNEDCELVIVNDYPLQKLVFDHPRVRIYNLDKTFATIGEKENYAIERCNGDIIAVWDDDDIAMKWHISNIKKWWEPNTNILFWELGAYYNEPSITALTGIGNSGIVYSKKAWEEIGKSPLENAGGDMTLVNKIIALGKEGVTVAKVRGEEISWFYRWQIPMNYHQSGMGTDTPDRPNIVERNAAFVEGLRARKLIPTGEVKLRPHWKRNYEQMLKTFTKNGTS